MHEDQKRLIDTLLHDAITFNKSLHSTYLEIMKQHNIAYHDQKDMQETLLNLSRACNISLTKECQELLKQRETIGSQQMNVLIELTLAMEKEFHTTLSYCVTFLATLKNTLPDNDKDLSFVNAAIHKCQSLQIKE